MSFGAVLFALFAAARSQAPTDERAVAPNRLSLAPSGSVQEAWVVRYDGPDHYSEHTEHIRSWFTGHGESDNDETS